jgi:hypothetical protein
MSIGVNGLRAVPTLLECTALLVAPGTPQRAFPTPPVFNIVNSFSGVEEVARP